MTTRDLLCSLHPRECFPVCVPVPVDCHTPGSVGSCLHFLTWNEHGVGHRRGEKKGRADGREEEETEASFLLLNFQLAAANYQRERLLPFSLQGRHLPFTSFSLSASASL